MRLLLIRHGPTAWNESGRLQGRADIPLSDAGRAVVADWRLPSPWREAPVIASPLRRARETAAILTDGPVEVEPALIEMGWGGFEGRRLADLRAHDPVGMAMNEAAGLDFRPPGGESPREVRDRLARALPVLAARYGQLVAVTHKGVIRVALSLATGWDMTTKPPLRLGLYDALPLSIDAGGRVTVDGAPLGLTR